MERFKVGIVQICAKNDKDRNIKRAEELIEEVVSKGAKVVLLPEMWNCPYRNEYFTKFAEEKYSKTYNFMKKIAREKEIILIGGSIPIKVEDKIYNESFVFNEKGQEIYSYKKMFMFDVVFENGKEFKESDTVESGNSIGVFETKYGKFGIVICYDLRFPELFDTMYRMGGRYFFIPGTFTKETGSKHWELLLRARAVDYQSYVFGASMARDEELSKNAFGNSRVVEPSGKIIEALNEKEATIVVEVCEEEVRKNSKMFPLENSRNNKVKGI